MHKVAVLLTKPLSMFELSIALEVFGQGQSALPLDYQLRLVSFDAAHQSDFAGLGLSVEYVTKLNATDTLIIPGWSTQNNKVRVNLAQAITQHALQGKRILSFNSGTFLLACLGMLRGKKATTHWFFAKQLVSRFPDIEYVADELFTQQDNICCSAGSAAALDLCLEIIRQDHGHRIANQMARRLLIAPHRQGGQAQYTEPALPAPGGYFAKTLDWALMNLSQPLLVDDLAERANMSRRSFDRHFRATIGISPKAWLNQQRVTLAKQILERGKTSMSQLARQAGFDSAVTLRFNFTKYVGISPSQYQNQFFMQ